MTNAAAAAARRIMRAGMRVEPVRNRTSVVGAGGWLFARPCKRPALSETPGIARREEEQRSSHAEDSGLGGAHRGLRIDRARAGRRAGTGRRRGRGQGGEGRTVILEQAPKDHSIAIPKEKLAQHLKDMDAKKLQTLRMIEGGKYNVNIRRITAAETGLVHPITADLWVVLEGGGTLTTGGVLEKGKILGGQSRPIKVGDVVYIPSGLPHGVSGVDKNITWLNVRWDTDWPPDSPMGAGTLNGLLGRAGGGGPGAAAREGSVEARAARGRGAAGAAAAPPAARGPALPPEASRCCPTATAAAASCSSRRSSSIRSWPACD